MKYYKNTNNELFIDPIVKNHIGLIELTKEEFDAQLVFNNTPSAEELVASTAAKFKHAKELALNSITVEVNGKVFDGRAKDQVNIMAAIQAAELLNKTEDTWVLNDDTKQIVTVDELKLALALSIQRVGEIVRG